ncbi:collagen binding domain-containing protein [Lactococcus garvieae]|uniref:collagen binding domain-containing protein n=2 Tax=Lactococcus garvieae TaxID=1363 RepID=UPI00254F3411|nr:collagen binding domain-containing protein [Lactococcus garvieae]
MKRTIQILLIFFTAFLGLMLHSEHASAAELSHTNFVDSLKFSTTKLTQGQTTSVRVEFSSKDNLKVKAGDTITFTLPAELQGMTENDGSPRKISLGELGEALIYKDRVIATFNEKVNQLEHVKGYFNFGLQATRTKNPNDTSIKTNLSTTATAQEITIHGDPGNTGEIGTLPFFWKSGDMLGEKGKVRWFVNANMTKEELSSDIILTDTHGLGQKLDAQSFRVSIENYLGNFQITGDEFVAKGYGSIQILPDDSFIITIKREHARLASFSFMYNTIITDNTVKSFTNTCNVNYQPYGQETVQDQGTSDVINLFADGDANGEQGLKEATEETLENNFEELEEIPAVETEKPNSSVTENEANQTAEKHQVESHVAPNQEVVEDESEQLEEMPAVEAEKPNSSVTENESNQTAEKNQVDIHVAPNQEVVEDESEQLEEMPAVEAEKPNSSVTENEANQTAEKHQVDIHVAPNQEVITDEPKKVKDVQHPQFEKAKPVVSEKKKSEKADVQTLGTKTNTSKSSTVTHSEKVEKQSGNTLPKTGEDKGFISVFTGFFLLFLSFVAFSLRRDRQA